MFDCNVFLQSIVSPRGPAGGCVDAATAGRIALFFSRYTMQELRSVAESDVIREKFPHLNNAAIDRMVANLAPRATYVKTVRQRYQLARDTNDSHYVDLAWSTGSELLVTRDNDLLDLMDQRTPAGRDFAQRFRGLRILTPEACLAALAR